MKHENRQFDAQEKQMEEALSRALSDAVQAPEGLADRVMAASAPLLVQASELDALLALATNAKAPEGLADRVMAASVPLLAQTSAFEELLEAATKVEVPEGLADRVMSASLKELRGESPVIGRVGFALKMQRLALAACVVFAVLVAIRMDVNTPTKIVVQHNQLLSAEEEGYLLEDLDLGDYTYLADARELNFAEISIELTGLRQDLELWEYGLLTE